MITTHKKVGRFRRWLIHLFGGIASDDVIQPTIEYNNVKLETLRVSLRIPETWNSIPNKYIKDNICFKLMEYIKPKIEEYIDQKEHYKIYRGSIEIPLKYIKEMDND